MINIININIQFVKYKFAIFYRKSFRKSRREVFFMDSRMICECDKQLCRRSVDFSSLECYPVNEALCFRQENPCMAAIASRITKAG